MYIRMDFLELEQILREVVNRHKDQLCVRR